MNFGSEKIQNMSGNNNQKGADNAHGPEFV
jgi:hypothetical protein